MCASKEFLMVVWICEHRFYTFGDLKMSKFVVYELKGNEKVEIAEAHTIEEAEYARSTIEKSRGSNLSVPLRIEKIFKIPKR